MRYNPKVPFAPDPETNPTEHYPYEEISQWRCKPYAETVRRMIRGTSNEGSPLPNGEGEVTENQVPAIDQVRAVLCGRRVLRGVKYRQETEQIAFDMDRTPTADQVPAAPGKEELRFDYDSAYAFTNKIVVQDTFKVQLPDGKWETLGNIPILLRGYADGERVHSADVATFKLGTFLPHGHVWIALPALGNGKTIPDDLKPTIWQWISSSTCADWFGSKVMLPNNMTASEEGHKREGIVFEKHVTRMFDELLRTYSTTFSPLLDKYYYVHTIRGVKQQTYYFGHDDGRAERRLERMFTNIRDSSLRRDDWFVDKGLEWWRPTFSLQPKQGCAANLIHALFPGVPLDRIDVNTRHFRKDVTSQIYAFECWALDTLNDAAFSEASEASRVQCYGTHKHISYDASSHGKGIWKTYDAEEILNPKVLVHAIKNAQAVSNQFLFALGHAEAQPMQRLDPDDSPPTIEPGEDEYAFRIRYENWEGNRGERTSTLRFEVTVPYSNAISAISHVSAAALAPYVYCFPIVYLW